MRTVMAIGLALTLLAAGSGCGGNEVEVTKPREGNRGAFRPDGKPPLPGKSTAQPPGGQPAGAK
jgi:hypothetical protein